MVGSGEKLYRCLKGRERVCVLGEGATSPHPTARGGLASGVWGAAPAEIEFGVF